MTRKIILLVFIFTAVFGSAVFWSIKEVREQTQQNRQIEQQKEADQENQGIAPERKRYEEMAQAEKQVEKEEEEINPTYITKVEFERKDEKIDTANWKKFNPHDREGDEFLMPPDWQEVFVGAYYGKFIINKKDVDSIDKNKLSAGEVRVYVYKQPGDSVDKISLLEQIQRHATGETTTSEWAFCMAEKNDQEFCEQYDYNPCTATEVLSEKGKQYAIVTCAYKEANEQNQWEYIFRKSLIHADSSGAVIGDWVEMRSLNNSLIDLNIFDVIFDVIKKRELKK